MVAGTGMVVVGVDGGKCWEGGNVVCCHCPFLVFSCFWFSGVMALLLGVGGCGGIVLLL